MSDDEVVASDGPSRYLFFYLGLCSSSSSRFFLVDQNRQKHFNRFAIDFYFNSAFSRRSLFLYLRFKRVLECIGMKRRPTASSRFFTGVYRQRAAFTGIEPRLPA